jgi:tRNA pseudouridine55 synthase
VLVLCIGAATRLAEYVQRMEKVYRAEIRLGARSDTDDAEGTITPVAVADPPGKEQVREGLQGFVGEIEQAPPAYSAAKVKGRRAYKLARAGEDVELEPRRVQIHEIDLRSYEYPNLVIQVRCGKGTYIRSLARDLGERLGCGGYIQALRRSRVGPFSADDALSLETDAETARSRLLPPKFAVPDLPRVALGPEDAMRFYAGMAVPLPPMAATEAAEFAVLAAMTGYLIGIGEPDADRRLQPTKVLKS